MGGNSVRMCGGFCVDQFEFDAGGFQSLQQVFGVDDRKFDDGGGKFSQKALRDYLNAAANGLVTIELETRKKVARPALP